MAKVQRFVSHDFTLRIASVDATDVVAEMQKLHNAFPVAASGVGKAMVGALLLASQLKDKQQIGLLFRGSGSLKSIYAEADFEGNIRAYTPHPQFEPESYDGGLKLSEALGKGTLTVARHVPFQKQPFQGMVELVTGEIGDDIAHYLHQSHQIRSIVSLGIYLDQQGQVQKAGGFIIEVMPGVDEAMVDLLQKNSEKQKPSVSSVLRDGGTPEDLIRPFMEGIDFMQLEHEHEIKYFCPCSKERVAEALTILGEEDLQDMVNKNEEPEVTCQMCGKPYVFTMDEVVEIRDRVNKKPLH
ncbi:Hsp33 family molecular chaperone HslO [Pseudobdellovibrio exovorus]|uniref:Heat-shock protein HSP33-like protein n=1 Tax=Pseudobdellovibrio exovorus JSS TaxID=1184267 RepID=M4VCV7_9BACT|nr:Hsp33 family molecular chaperone HslO [Pseudobdellovibrio exovorus]AGH95871.1 heat-shock protein HSP33-like protein [Pseudobdellovibrio exovorus JSS]